MSELQRGVYFIYAPNQNKIKIGRSKNIPMRFLHLRTGFMDDGILLAGIITAKEVMLEKSLHTKFAHLRDRSGECFFITRELVDFIVALDHVYENVNTYNSLTEIQRRLTYSSLGMFRLVVGLKDVQNKLLTPLLFSIAGFLIAWYQYKFDMQHEQSFPLLVLD
jgi:hypothetical protein